jgi:hypothetical protein
LWLGAGVAAEEVITCHFTPLQLAPQRLERYCVRRFRSPVSN